MVEVRCSVAFPKRCWLNQTKEDGITFNEQLLRIDERFWAVFQNCAANFDGWIREQEEVSLVSVNRRGGDHVDRNRWDGKPCRGNQRLVCNYGSKQVKCLVKLWLKNGSPKRLSRL